MDRCPQCGKNLALVGRAHLCSPPVKSKPGDMGEPSRKGEPSSLREPKGNGEPRAEREPRLSSELKKSRGHPQKGVSEPVSRTTERRPRKRKK